MSRTWMAVIPVKHPLHILDGALHRLVIRRAELLIAADRAACRGIGLVGVHIHDMGAAVFLRVRYLNIHQCLVHRHLLVLDVCRPVLRALPLGIQIPDGDLLHRLDGRSESIALHVFPVAADIGRIIKHEGDRDQYQQNISKDQDIPQHPAPVQFLFLHPAASFCSDGVFTKSTNQSKMLVFAPCT